MGKIIKIISLISIILVLTVFAGCNLKSKNGNKTNALKVNASNEKVIAKDKNYKVIKKNLYKQKYCYKCYFYNSANHIVKEKTYTNQPKVTNKYKNLLQISYLDNKNNICEEYYDTNKCKYSKSFSDSILLNNKLIIYERKDQDNYKNEKYCTFIMQNIFDSSSDIFIDTKFLYGSSLKNAKLIDNNHLEIICLENGSLKSENIEIKKPASSDEQVEEIGPDYMLSNRISGSQRGYKYYIYDSSDNLVHEEEPGRCPSFSYINNDLLEIRLGTGTGIYISQYYDIKNNKFSTNYQNSILLNNDLIVYEEPVENKSTKIIVQNLFDKNLFYKEIKRNFVYTHSYYPIKEAELLDNNRLEITYLVDAPNDSYAEKREIIDLREY